jgi:hypothetical protein
VVGCGVGVLAGVWACCSDVQNVWLSDGFFSFCLPHVFTPLSSSPFSSPPFPPLPRHRYYFKRMDRGKFQKKIIGTHRTYPKYSKINLKPKSISTDKIYKEMLEACHHIKTLVKEEAFKLDDQAREKDNRRKMKQIEEEMKLYLTELKIWNACVKMGCCFRMWIAQAEFRRRKQAVLTIQSMLRCYIAMLRFSKLRGLLRLRAAAHNAMYLNRLQSWNASIRLMKTTAVAMYAKRLTMLMVTRRLVITNTVAQSAHCIRHTINDEVLRRARMKLSTLATLVHSHGRILHCIETEKRRRSAICLQRMFRSRLMKQLLMVLSGSKGCYPNMALSLW